MEVEAGVNLDITPLGPACREEYYPHTGPVSERRDLDYMQLVLAPTPEGMDPVGGYLLWS